MKLTRRSVLIITSGEGRHQQQRERRGGGSERHRLNTREGRKVEMRFTIFALVVACGALLVPGALAGKPDRHRVPLGSSTVFPAGVACPEEVAPAGVRTELIGGNEAVTSFDDGRFLATARHIVEFTNLASPDRSVVLDVQGNFAEVPQEDGSFEMQGSGTTAFIFFPGDAGPGDTTSGRIYLFTGNLRLVADGSFVIVAFESAGRTPQDVCAMIAA